MAGEENKKNKSGEEIIVCSNAHNCKYAQKASGDYDEKAIIKEIKEGRTYYSIKYSCKYLKENKIDGCDRIDVLNLLERIAHSLERR